MTSSVQRLADVLSRPLVSPSIDFQWLSRCFRYHTDGRTFVILEEHVVDSIVASRMFNAACLVVAVARRGSR